MYALRTFICLDCHRPFTRRRPKAWEGRCIPCAVAYSAEEQRQLANHSGPLYQKWAWNLTLAARRALASSGPDESLKQAS